MPRRSRVRVMIIVPTFSERDEGNPPVVTGIVPCQETARAPHVSHRVHHPRAMQTDHHAKANTPQEHGKPSQQEQRHGKHNHGEPVIIVQPHIETVFGQIGCVLRHELGVIVLGLPDEKPAHMRPPGAVPRRMWIAGLVGFLMVNAMRGNPENRPAFQGQGSANRKEILQPPKSKPWASSSSGCHGCR